ncbi:MAG: molybdopterin-guanine dinucleotide biosynthesis protein B [Brevibacillus sp.]|nr:molybdopterin-guanine dinucleotide biosynthesis protein B [Brevibacillus sp.]
MPQLPPIIQIVGYANTGKTTLITELIRCFQQLDRRVGVIKRDGHDHEWEREGTDTWRFREAGAPLVALQSSSKTAWFEQQSLSLSDLVWRMGQAGADLIIVEGFKTAAYPKLLLVRAPQQLALLDQLTACRAIVSWFPFQHPVLPVFSIDDQKRVASFVEALLLSDAERK